MRDRAEVGEDGTLRGDAPGGRRWSVVAGLCLVAAAVLWVVVGVDAAFVFATFGVLAWFWDYRNRIEPRGIESDGPAEADGDADEEFEDGPDGDDGGEAERGGESEDEVELPRRVER